MLRRGLEQQPVTSVRVSSAHSIHDLATLINEHARCSVCCVFVEKDSAELVKGDGVLLVKHGLHGIGRLPSSAPSLCIGQYYY